MATIDPSIAMGYKPIQVENPMNQMAALSQIQSGQNQNALAQYQLASAQRADEKVNFLNQRIAERTNKDTGAIDYPNLYKDVAQGGFGSYLPELIKQQQAGEKEAGLIKKTKVETEGLTFKQKIDKQNKALAAIAALDTPEAALADINKHLSMGEIDESQATTLRNAISTAPNFRAWQKSTLLSTLDGKDRLISEETARHNLQTETNAAEQLKVSKGNLAVSQQRLKAELDSTGTLTPAAIDVAAQIYIQTGTLPALGIGKNAGNLKSAVLNRATELYNNPAGAAPSVNAPTGANAPAPFNAANMAEQIIGNKMDVAAKSKAVRDFASGPESRKITAFNTAINHLDTLSKLSVALQNNDVQAINYIGNAFAKATGQPAPTTFDAAKSIIGSEIAKAVSGAGATALGDRKEIREAIESKNSPAQLAEVINGFTELLGGQLDSMQHTYKSSTGRTDFNTKLTPRAREVVSKLSTNATASPNTVTTSDGKTYNFPTPEDAAKFKQAAGIK